MWTVFKQALCVVFTIIHHAFIFNFALKRSDGELPKDFVFPIVLLLYFGCLAGGSSTPQNVTFFGGTFGQPPVKLPLIITISTVFLYIIYDHSAWEFKYIFLVISIIISGIFAPLLFFNLRFLFVKKNES